MSEVTTWEIRPAMLSIRLVPSVAGGRGVMVSLGDTDGRIYIEWPAVLFVGDTLEIPLESVSLPLDVGRMLAEVVSVSAALGQILQSQVGPVLVDPPSPSEGGPSCLIV